ncbi:UNVERIFIED_ORG: ABC transporter family protein [Burkholderia sp. CF145]
MAGNTHSHDPPESCHREFQHRHAASSSNWCYRLGAVTHCLFHGPAAGTPGAPVSAFTPGEKIGLVGRNGAGKSSFLGLLNGTLHEDSGEFSIPAAWKMGQVAQEMPETEQSATDFVVEGDTVLLAAHAEVAAAEASDDGMRMAHAYMDLHDAVAHDAPPVPRR